MSLTQNWSWVISMNQEIYGSLRNLIYSKVVPSNPTDQTYTYDGVTYTISLSFQPLQTTIDVDTSQTNVLTITAGVTGNITPQGGVMDSFKGDVSVDVCLDDLYIQPNSPADTSDDSDTTSWNNFLYLSTGAVTNLTLNMGDTLSGTNEAALQQFMQSEIDDYIASSPHSLGEQTSDNLPSYFTPTYIRFITLTEGNYTDAPCIMELIMVNNEAPPSSTSNTDFCNTTQLYIPDGSDAVFALNDYTMYDYMATQINANGNANLNSVSVSQDPTVLTAQFSNNDFKGTLTSQIKNDSIQTSLQTKNFMSVSLTYQTTFDIIEGTDGQELEVKNTLTQSSVEVNTGNATVNDIIEIYDQLGYLSPLGGGIWWGLWQGVKQAIISAINSKASKLEFDKTTAIKEHDGEYVDLSVNGINLYEGIILDAQVAVNTPETSTESSTATATA